MGSANRANNVTFEVAISGISGTFPESENVPEFIEHLFNKTNLVSDDNIRWNPGLWRNIPNATGKVKNLRKLDATFFGLLRPLANSMDPLVRITLEKVYEAVVDAGMNPSILQGQNTLVYGCSSNSEAESCTVCTIHSSVSYLWLLTHAHTFLANRMSNALNIHGSSATTFSSFTGGLDILKLAVNDIKQGRVRSALVVVSNVVLYPEIMRSHNALNMLSQNGMTKAFDEDATGYGRSDGAVVLFLQRAEDARKEYARIVDVNVHQGNDVPRNFLSVKPESFKQFLAHFYTNCKVPPSDVSYYEAYGCGVPVIDETELNVVTDYFCNNRKGPLKVGSVKSNAGHTETASSFVSIVKAAIALDSGFIPPNINYSTPNSKIPGLSDGRLEVVTEKTILDGDYVAVNCFNLFGGMGHVLLQRRKEKRSVTKLNCDIPRLILFSARHELGIAEVMAKIESGPMNSDYHDLIQRVFSKNVLSHFLRGYTILPIEEPSPTHGSLEMISEKRSVWFICTGMGCQWTSMASELMLFPVFAKSLHECASILKPFGVDLIKIVTHNDRAIFNDILNGFIAITAIQIGLVDLLFALGIKPDGIIGHSLGEVCCCYVDGCFTKQQAIMCSYFRGLASAEVPVPEGMMVAVGSNYKDLTDLPPNVFVGCRNSSTSCTLSGLAKDMEIYCEKLKQRKIFHRVVNTNKRAYHSKYVFDVAKEFVRRFEPYVQHPKKRSAKWISSSVPEEQWSTESAKYASVQYHYNNFVSTVLFDAACAHIPENAIVIEVAPHGLLQSILTRELPPSCLHIPLMKREAGNQVKFLLSAIGKLYTAGLEVNLDVLYPPPTFPISTSTPSLAPLMTWNHSDDWSISEFKGDEPKSKTLNLRSSAFKFLLSYQIEGKIILPATFLLVELMEELCMSHDIDINCSAFHLQQVIFKEHLILDINDVQDILIQCNKANGNFEFVSEDKILSSGTMNVQHLDSKSLTIENNWYEENISRFSQLSCQNSTNVRLEKPDLDVMFENIGIHLSSPFDLVERLILSENECLASVRWTNNKVAFLDAIMKIQVALDIIFNTNFVALLPSYFLSLSVNFAVFKNIPEGSFIPVFVDLKLRCMQTKGLNLFGLETSPMPLISNPSLEAKTLKFLRHINPQIQGLDQFLDLCLQLIKEILSANWTNDGTSISVLELKCTKIGPISQKLKLISGFHSDVCVDFQLLDNIENILSVLNRNSVVVDNGQILKSCFKRFTDGFLLTSLPANEHLFIDADTALISEIVCDGRKYVLLRRVTCQNMMRVLKMDETYFDLKSIEKYIIDTDDTVALVWEKLKNIDPLRILHQVKKSKIHKESIRFVFILDSNVRSFSLDDPFYNQRLKCGLVVNILENGHWGGLNYVSIFKQNSQSQIDPSPLLLGHSIERFNSRFSYISVNLKDLTIDLNSEREMDFRYIDYVGFDSENKKVVGLAYFEEGGANLQCDPVLQWRAPDNWSDEDLSTLPYLYSLAYYMLGILPATSIKDKPVLIHCGNSALGLASINVALELGAVVLTTVESNEQALLILKQFPQLKQSHVLHLDGSLDLKVRQLTAESKGVFVVINPYFGKLLGISLNLLSFLGCYVQLGNLEMKNKVKVGMNAFLRSISLYGLADLELSNRPLHVKTEIHHFIAQKLSSSSLKPLPRMVFSYNEKSAIFDFLTKKTQGNKAVVSVSNTETREPLPSAAEATYLVIASKESTWLQLVSWLLKKSAKKIVIALTGNNANKALEHQLFQLMHKYNKVSFLLLLDSDIDTPRGTQTMFKAACNLGHLDIILCLAMDEVQLINVDSISRQMGLSKSYLISLLNDSEELCHYRTVDGYPSLNVECKGHSKQLKCILPYLENIIDPSSWKRGIFPASTVSINQYESQKRKSGNFNLLLPTSLRDLIDLSNELAQSCTFKEVMTRSCPHKFTQECDPVFFVPGFSCKSLKNIFKRLLYPAYCATPLFCTESAEATAFDLFQSLKQIKPTGSYTIVAETWSNCIALELGLLLENNGDVVKIILLNGSPETVKQHILDFKTNFSALSQNHNLSIHLLKFEEINLNALANQIISNSNNGFTSDDKERIKCSLLSVQTKLIAAQSYKMKPQIFKGEVIIVKQQGSSSEVCPELIQNINEKQEIHFTTADSYESLVNDPEVATLINKNAIIDWM